MIDHRPLNSANGQVDLTVETALRELLVDTLEYCDGNLEWVASEMGVAHKTVYNWLARFGLQRARRYIRRQAHEEPELKLVEEA